MPRKNPIQTFTIDKNVIKELDRVSRATGIPKSRIICRAVAKELKCLDKVAKMLSGKGADRNGLERANR